MPACAFALRKSFEKSSSGRAGNKGLLRQRSFETSCGPTLLKSEVVARPCCLEKINLSRQRQAQRGDDR